MDATERNVDPIAEAARHWRRHWGEEPVPAMVAVTSIMRVQQILLGRLNAVLKPFGITFARYEALMLLYYSRRGSLPLGKMGDRLQVHRTSITSIVDGLEKSQLVRREAHERDRRTVLATITDAGRRTAEAATRVLDDERFGLAALDDDQLELLSGLLYPVRAAADELGEAGPDGRSELVAATGRRGAAPRQP